MPRNLRDSLPLKPVDLELLIALAQEDQHGYGLLQSIERSTDGLLRLDPGNLYRVIKRMLDDGLIAHAERRSESEADERRRYYRLTTLGRRVLAAEVARLRGLMRSPAVRAIQRGWAT